MLDHIASIQGMDGLKGVALFLLAMWQAGNAYGKCFCRYARIVDKHANTILKQHDVLKLLGGVAWESCMDAVQLSLTSPRKVRRFPVVVTTRLQPHPIPRST